MNRIPQGEGACEKTRKYLDSYISNELLVETTHELLRHLEGCPECSAELDARTRLRSRLKAAVEAQPAPAELQARVRERIRNQGRSTWAPGWGKLTMATAASLVMAAGVWLNFGPERLPSISDRPAQNAYIQKISARMAAVLKLGLGDHIHCAVFRKNPKDRQEEARMIADLGPSFQGLLPVVRSTLPAGYRIVMAHQCGYLGRKYVHFTTEKDGELLSLVIARKQQGETLDGLAPAAGRMAVPIYTSSAAHYQVAAFDAGDFFAYVVSDLKPGANVQVAGSLAPSVREFLIKVTA